MTYDSSQLMNLVAQANVYFSQLYGGLYSPRPIQTFNTINLGSYSGNPFGPFNNIAALKFEPISFKSSSTTTSSSNLALGKSTSSCLEAVRLAELELKRGVREIGSSNDSVDIRKYKNGAKNNHQWCAYFTSWLYGRGQGSNNKSTFGFDASTQSIKRKAINAGCYASKNSGYTPRVGDLAMWTKSASKGHVGIVTKVYADGSFDVIEGNSGNKVAKHHYKSQSSVGSTFNGFVKMNEWTA